MGTNGITYNRDPFARAARLIRGLGCEVAADKRQVPVLYHENYCISVHHEGNREKNRQRKQCQPSSNGGGLFHAIISPDPRCSPKIHPNPLMELPNYPYYFPHILYLVYIRRCMSTFLHPSYSYLRRDSVHPIQGFNSASYKLVLSLHTGMFYHSRRNSVAKPKTENPTIENQLKISYSYIIKNQNLMTTLRFKNS